MENGIFQRNNNGGTLTFDLGNENNNVIQFSDRPFRQTQKISISTFVNYFTLGGSNSFKKDPPNMVLAHSQEQRTYIMKLSSKSNNQVVFTLELLPGETHNLNTVTGRMSVFVDNFFDSLILDADDAESNAFQSLYTQFGNTQEEDDEEAEQVGQELRSDAEDVANDAVSDAVNTTREGYDAVTSKNFFGTISNDADKEFGNISNDFNTAESEFENSINGQS